MSAANPRPITTPRLRTVHASAGFVLSALMFAGACVYMSRHTKPTGLLADHLGAQCPPDATHVAYTGHPGTDHTMCVLVGFFQTLHSGRPQLLYSIDLLTSLTPIYNIMLLEASRFGRSKFVASPTIFAMLGQLFGGGYAFPIYLAVFFLSGAARNKSSLIQTQAECVLVGLLAGYCVPTVAMFLHQDDRATAFWQPYPLWGSIAQQIYLFLRPKPEVARQSGYKTVQLTLLISFLSSAIVHLGIIAPLLLHPIEFISSIIPYFPPTTATATDAVNATYDFLKWDGVFIYSSFLLAGLPFTNTLSEFGLAFVSLTIASIFLGPGAAIAAMWSWKEMKYEEERQGKLSKSE